MEEVIDLQEKETHRERRRLKLKRNKRKRIALKTTILVILIAGIGLGTFFLIQGIRKSYFDIKHVLVVGNDLVDRQTVIETTKIPVNTCIFSADINQIRHNIEQTIDCHHLIISKKFPDTIVINIEEKKAFCVMVVEGETYYLDGNFRIIEISEYLRKTDIPLISGLTGIEKLQVGNTVELKPNERAAEIKKMLTIFSNSGYHVNISEMIADADGTYRIITKNNLVFRVDDSECFKKFYDYIATLIEKNKSNISIDLTMGDYPVLKNR